jgi:glycine cleavage system H protein
MNIPDELRYAPTHEWIRSEGDEWLVGISGPAQEMLGDVVFVGELSQGVHLAAGERAGVVESVKAASDFHAPVAGTITAVNAALAADPSLINSDPYGTWIFKLKVDNPAEIDALLDGPAYRALLGAA